MRCMGLRAGRSADGRAPGSHESGERRRGGRPDGPGRRAFLASKTAIFLLQVCAFLCLLLAAASLAGYLPRAVGPALVLTATSVVGFVLAAIEGRRA